MIEKAPSLLFTLLVAIFLSGCNSGDFSASATSTLSILTISDGTLEPAFSGNQENYLLTVKDKTQAITFTPVPAHDLSTITVNGVSAKAGSKSAPVAITKTPQEVIINVTSSDGSRSTRYKITVVRPGDTPPAGATTPTPVPQQPPATTGNSKELASLSLGSAPLTQTFNPASLIYNSEVSYLTRTETVTAKPANSKSRVLVNGKVVSAPAFKAPVYLNEGDNLVLVVVEPADGSEPRTYELTIKRNSADNFVQQNILKASDPQTGSRFGFSIASSNDVVAISAPEADNGGKREAGVVYIFKRIDGNWVSIQRLGEPAPATRNWFGYNLAMQNDTLVVSSFGYDGNARDGGRVYVYQGVTGQNWQLASTINSPKRKARERFGYNVVLSGDYLAVATLRGIDGTSTGGDVYLYKRQGNGWKLNQTIDIAGSSDRYGESIAMDGNVLAIGSFSFDDECRRRTSDPGSVTLYRLKSGKWSKEDVIKASNAGGGDRFGFTMSPSGNTLAVGAICEDSSSTNPNDNLFNEVGAVYVFTEANGNWKQQAYIKEPVPAMYNLFGSRIELDNGLLAISADLSDTAGEDTGITYLYEGAGANWEVVKTLQPGDVKVLDEFGFDMAMSDGNLLIGSTQPKQNAPTSSGKVYAYH
ncbi:MAG TPA: hypothetical protein ENJ35_00080 [Gammaproteobacteria bacterium]|nr:hypothetical protein [Gammaproteobacteria bacterium]